MTTFVQEEKVRSRTKKQNKRSRKMREAEDFFDSDLEAEVEEAKAAVYRPKISDLLPFMVRNKLGRTKKIQFFSS